MTVKEENLKSVRERKPGPLDREFFDLSLHENNNPVTGLQYAKSLTFFRDSKKLRSLTSSKKVI
jgi:hypothetical protein